MKSRVKAKLNTTDNSLYWRAYLLVNGEISN